MLAGYCATYTNNASELLNAKYGWTTTSEIAIYQSLVGSSVILGYCIGAASGGKFIKIGRRKMIIIACLLGMLSTTVTLF